MNDRVKQVAWFGGVQAATTEDGSLMPLAKQCRWRQCQRCK